MPSPFVSQSVHLWTTTRPSVSPGQPIAALVTAVQSDTVVNITAFPDQSDPFGVTHLPYVADYTAFEASGLVSAWSFAEGFVAPPAPTPEVAAAPAFVVQDAEALNEPIVDAPPVPPVSPEAAPEAVSGEPTTATSEAPPLPGEGASA